MIVIFRDSAANAGTALTEAHSTTAASRRKFLHIAVPPANCAVIERQAPREVFQRYIFLRRNILREMDHSRRSEVDTDQMISTAPDISADETTRFTCEAQHLEVECSPPVLRAICAAAAKGASQLRRGGLEVGGILLGRRAGDGVRGLATRSIKCEYRFGPSFVLSDNDRVMLEQSLNRLQLEPDLAALEPVGCYYSHSRHGADLTPSDIDVWNKYFPRPFQ